MNRKSLAMAGMALGLAVSLLVGCGGPSTTRVEGAKSRIEGTVTLKGDAGTKPIANAEVFLATGLSDDPADEVARTTTDPQGGYSFEDVTPGTWVVGAEVHGGGYGCSHVMPDVNVTPGRVTRVDLQLSCTP